MDSIWFDGHFPDAAVLPGVAQLAMIVEILGKTLGSSVRVSTVSKVRFKQAILPADTIDIQIMPKEKDSLTYGFRLMKSGELACSGSITLAEG